MYIVYTNANEMEIYVQCQFEYWPTLKGYFLKGPVALLVGLL